jgi:hypothetical protein
MNEGKILTADSRVCDVLGVRHLLHTQLIVITIQPYLCHIGSC